MADNTRRKPMSESELSAAYTKASYEFANTSGWRELLSLADDFRLLDTYKDSPQMVLKCIKGASAPAYREITTSFEGRDDVTVEEYREAARVMGLISDYMDARELMRVYTVRANILTYEMATDILSNSETDTEAMGRAVEMLRTIKTFRNSRDLLERFEKHYFDTVYREALHLLENGKVYTEFDEAAEMFEKISVYSDAKEQAAICRKRANQLRPKTKKAKPEKAAAKTGDQATRVKPTRRKQENTEARQKKPKDETVSGVLEVWRDIDKRKFAQFLLWLALFVGAIVFSIQINKITMTWIMANADLIRMLCVIAAGLSAVMGTRAFLQMLTASMRKKLAKAALAFGQKLAKPFVKAVTKLLASIGIDITRRRRLGGRDEKSIVHTETETVKKKKKRLKNELKWVEQTSNSARVRFIFIDYMIHRIKNGYKMRYSMTTAEIGKEIAIEPEEQELFRVYQMARYSGGRADDEISDAKVNELRVINLKKGSAS
ncbi:MAG: hypothetical protein E7661_02560 [Ruminococcaceae bacterium]|nr:hypothetical protein [Oscillospiraceae bacterium]